MVVSCCRKCHFVWVMTMALWCVWLPLCDAFHSPTTRTMMTMTIRREGFFSRSQDPIFGESMRWFAAATAPTVSSSSRLWSSMKGDGGDSSSTLGDDEEETLMRIRLSTKEGGNNKDVSPLEAVQQYARSFPFAPTLPVQPLQAMPTPDGGMDLHFLRKKTTEKSSVDGGIRFYILPEANDILLPKMYIDVVAKRNSEGQSLNKIFSEKLIIQAFVRGLVERIDDKNQLGNTLSVESVFHKWLE
jgi:hypothetical protein